MKMTVGDGLNLAVLALLDGRIGGSLGGLRDRLSGSEAAEDSNGQTRCDLHDGGAKRLSKEKSGDENRIDKNS